MAVKGTYTRLFINEFDFAGDNHGLSFTSTVPGLNHTTFQDTGEEFIAGLPSGVISHQGYFNGSAAGTYEAEMTTELGAVTGVYVATVFGTNQTAPVGYVTENTWGQQITFDNPVDGISTLDGEWQTVGQVYRGVMIYRGTISATGTTTAIDLGTQGTAGGKGFLFIQTITGGATNADIDIESSATEGGAYASEGTFTFSAVGVQTMDMSGTVDRWLRLNTTDMGTATNFTVACIACTSGVTY